MVMLVAMMNIKVTPVEQQLLLMFHTRHIQTFLLFLFHTPCPLSRPTCCHVCWSFSAPKWRQPKSLPKLQRMMMGKCHWRVEWLRCHSLCFGRLGLVVKGLTCGKLQREVFQHLMNTCHVSYPSSKHIETLPYMCVG